MGAWIEINPMKRLESDLKASHPLWVRGLKSITVSGDLESGVVAPFMGAWIEIFHQSLILFP